MDQDLNCVAKSTAMLVSTESMLPTGRSQPKTMCGWGYLPSIGGILIKARHSQGTQDS